MGRDTEAPTVDQLRKEIDRGQSGDKTPGVDPAAAPLGTDDEAAGHPPTEEERAMAAEAQRAEDPKRPTAGGDATESLRAAETRKGEEEVARPGTDAASAPPRAGARRKASGRATSGPTRATPRTRSRRRAAGRRRRRSAAGEALPPERREVRLEQRQPVLAPEHLLADDVARRAEHPAPQRLVGVALDGLDRGQQAAVGERGVEAGVGEDRAPPSRPRRCRAPRPRPRAGSRAPARRGRRRPRPGR